MKSLIVPPLTLISSTPKSVDASERVNVIVAVSPAFKALSLDVIVMPGITVSTARVSDPEVFALPAASTNPPEETGISPLEMLSSVGVNTAV